MKIKKIELYLNGSQSQLLLNVFTFRGFTRRYRLSRTSFCCRVKPCPQGGVPTIMAPKRLTFY